MRRLAHGAPWVALWPGIRLSVLETRETQAPALGREGPLEEGAAAQGSCLENTMRRGAWRLQSVESQSQTTTEHTYDRAYDLKVKNFWSLRQAIL